MGILDSFGDGKPQARDLALGTISRIDGMDVYVVVPSFNRTHEHGPCGFEHAADAAEGDAVLVGFDEQGSPWIAAWAGEVAGGDGTDPDAIHTGDAAGGVLSGTYPSPGFAVDMATQAELNAEAVTRAADDATEAAARATVAANLATHAGLTTSAHGGIVASTDTRLTDARTPTAHAASHGSIGSDPVTIAESQVTGLTADLALKAPLASPALTGNPTAPTAAVDDNDTSIATTAYVIGQASAAGDGTPAMNGTAARGTSTHFARADHVHPTDTSRAPLASPALTGDPTAPTPSVGDNDTSIATTAFVQAIITALGLSGKKIKFGTGVATFAGGSVASSVNITHGLGATPTQVFLTPQSQSGLNSIPAMEAGTFGATTFNAQAWTIDAQQPVNGSTVTFSWMAVA